MIEVDWKRPYQRSLKGEKFILFSLLAGLFVALFLIIFQPFGLFEWQHSHKLLVISGFGIITALLLLLSYVGVEVWWKKENWTLGEQAASVFIRTLSIGLFNGLYAFAVGLAEFTWMNIMWYILVTFAIGIFPVTALMISDYFKQIQISYDNENENDERVIKLIAENDKEELLIPINQLLYISSSDNYCEIVRYDKGIIKELLRNTLKDVDDQIEYSEIIRCHRSYIVNLLNTKNCEGNSQGMKINFKWSDEQIHVSRKYVSKLKRKIQQLNTTYEF